MFGFCFLKLFLRTIFENTNNTILVFFENTNNIILVFFKIFYYFLNLMFYMFSVVFIIKKLGTKHVLLILHVFVVFENKN